MSIHKTISLTAFVALTGCTMVPEETYTHRSVVVYSDGEPNRVIVRKSDPGYRYYYETPRPYYRQDSYRYYYRYYY